MKLKEIMTLNIEAISKYASLQLAAIRMKERNVGALPVYEGLELVGVVTDRDITVRGIAGGKDPARASVMEVMSPQVHALDEEKSVEEAAKYMQEKQIRRLLVVNKLLDVVGIVSLGDIALESGDKKMTGETLIDISRPSAEQAKAS